MKANEQNKEAPSLSSRCRQSIGYLSPNSIFPLWHLTSRIPSYATHARYLCQTACSYRQIASWAVSANNPYQWLFYYYL